MSLPPALSAPGLSRASLAPLPGTHRLGQAPSHRATRHHGGGGASSPVHCLPTKPSKPQQSQRPSLTTSPVGDTAL